MTRPSVLHVLARPGGGGERYVDTLAHGLDAYEHQRFLLTNRSKPIKRPPLEAARRLVPLRREMAGHELVHVHGAPALLICLPVLRPRATVFTTHGLNLLHTRPPRSTLAAAGLRRALDRGVRAIAVSGADRDALLAAAPGFADSITVVRHGVEIEAPAGGDRAATRRELGLPESTVALLFVGELAEHKQPIQLAEAIRCARGRGSDVTGLFVGDGPLRQALDAAGNGAVSLLGPRDDTGALLEAADAFVLPSLHEGLSLALLEAMAAGRPVVASQIPSNVEALGEAGILVPIGDTMALCEAIVRLAADGGLRRRLGEAARKRVEERFELSRMLRETAAIYDRVLPARG